MTSRVGNGLTTTMFKSPIHLSGEHPWLDHDAVCPRSNPLRVEGMAPDAVSPQALKTGKVYKSIREHGARVSLRARAPARPPAAGGGRPELRSRGRRLRLRDSGSPGRCPARRPRQRPRQSAGALPPLCCSGSASRGPKSVSRGARRKSVPPKKGKREVLKHPWFLRVLLPLAARSRGNVGGLPGSGRAPGSGSACALPPPTCARSRERSDREAPIVYFARRRSICHHYDVFCVR